MKFDSFDIENIAGNKAIEVGKKIADENCQTKPTVVATCGSAWECSGGGGQCGSAWECSGGGGQCGSAWECSGGGGRCGSAWQCAGT